MRKGQTGYILFLVLLLFAGGKKAASGQKVLWEERFDTAQSLQNWQTNQDLTDLKVTEGQLQFRAIGPDPILVYQAPMNVAATPFQAIEIRMKSDRDGTAELFWSGTTTGQYGGFSGEKRSEFAVRGDGQWHDYRIFPFWHKEGRIVRLRFDPYDGAQFTVAQFRIVGWDASKAAADAAFDFKRDMGWQSLYALTAQQEPDGLMLQLKQPDGFAISPPLEVAAETNSVVSVRLSATRARRATLVFATAESYGLHSLSFALQPDGKPHTYNLDMLNAPDWKGRIIAVGIRPGEKTGDTLRLHSLRIAATPQGPPELRLLSLGIEETPIRAGLPMTVSARLTNGGGQPAQNVKLKLTLPPSVRLVKSESASTKTLRYGEEREWRWKVIFSRPTKARLRLSAQATNTASTTAETVANVTRPAATTRAAYVPVPKPVKTKVQVGVYYFPGWKSAGQWSPITRFPERRPVLGWYREGDPKIADWHIKWAVEHGITFFAYDWYWTQGSRMLDHALHNGFFHARYRSMMKFCLLWANHNAPGTSSEADCLAVTRYWIENYFRRPEHLQIDGKPVVIIFSPYRLREDMGSESVRRAFDAMREECQKAGLKGLYLIACVGGTGEAQVTANEGYDAITCYNWAGLGVQGNERWSPYTAMTEGYRRQWESLAERSPIPLMVPVSGGWDSRPWHGDAALVRSNRTPDYFRQHLNDALQFINTNPQKTVPFVLAEAWNEWGEGSYIEPHQEYGFGYLDAIRDVFSTAPKTHTDITPLDVGLTVPQVTFNTLTRTLWKFAQDVGGWETGMDITEPRIQDGTLKVRTTGNDPAFFGPPMQIPAESYPTLRLRMRMRNADGTPFTDVAQLFWATRTASESESNSVKFEVKADGQWHEYRLRLADNPRWRGQVTRLRFDPCARRNVAIEVAHIELVETTKSSDK